MGRWISFWKSLFRSLKRVALLLLIAVACLLIILWAFGIRFRDFMPPKELPEYTRPRIFYPINSYDNSAPDQTKHYGVNKPGVLESIVNYHVESIANIYDNWMDFRYSNPPDLGLFIKYLRYQFKEKTIVADSSLINRDMVLRDFYEKTGFMGNINDPNYNPYFLGRNLTFSYLKGSFNLPEPLDTTSFRSNADFLVKNILAMYGGEKAGFILIKSPVYRESGVYYREIKPKSSKENSLYYRREFIPYVKKEAVGYYAIYDQKLDKYNPSVLRKSDSNCELVIKYKEMSKQYEIYNQLFEVPLSIPKDKIGRQKAIKIATSVMLKRSGLPKTALDTLSIEVRKGYSINVLDPYSIAQYRYRVQSSWYIRFTRKYPDIIYISPFPFEEKNNRYQDNYEVDAYSGRIQWENNVGCGI